MSISRRQLGADGSLLLVSLIWGSTFVVVKDALDTVPRFAFLAFRFAVAAAALAALFGRSLFRIDRRTLSMGFIMGLALFAGFAAQTAGMVYTTASKAAFITGLNVVLVPIGSAFLAKTKPSARSVFGTVLAVAGLGMLCLQDSLVPGKGDVLVLLCAFAFALHIVLVGKYGGSYDSSSLCIVQMATACACSLAASLLFGGLSETVIRGRDVWGAVAYLGTFATAGAFGVQVWAQKVTTATRTALIFSLEPVFAAVFAWFLLHEAMTAVQILGCVAIMAGIVASEIGADTAEHGAETGTETVGACSSAS